MTIRSFIHAVALAWRAGCSEYRRAVYRARLRSAVVDPWEAQ